MVATARAPESPENKVSVPFTYDEPVPPNTEVFVRYSVDNWATFETKKLSKRGDRFLLMVDMDEGTSYKYLYRITVPGQPDQWDPPGGVGTYKEGIAEGEPVTPATPGGSKRASSALPDGFRKDVKTEVAQVLTSAKDAKSADRIGALTEQLESLVRQRHGVKEDITNLVLAVLAEIIREDKTLPAEIRAQFSAESPLSDFRDLTARLEKGAKLYIAAVFLRLSGDESARRFFKLNARARYNDSDPLGNPKFNEVFRRHCDSRCLTAGAAYFEKHLKAVAEKEVVDPTLLRERMSDADRIISRLPAEEQSRVKKMLKEIPTERKSQVIDWLVSAGGAASVVGLDGGIGITVAVIKSLAEGVTGVSLREVMTAVDRRDFKPIIDAAWRNNVFSHSVKARGNLWQRTKETIGRMIPVWSGFRHAGKSVSGFEAQGISGEGGDTGTVSADQLIEKALNI
ncbi:hypothetical protein HZC21_01690 [Candidatus Peregrinibacteria bacterium]|nr:hypothetical protein [Candidatus Peregrinibacteria bacterium]